MRLLAAVFVIALQGDKGVLPELPLGTDLATVLAFNLSVVSGATASDCGPIIIDGVQVADKEAVVRDSPLPPASAIFAGCVNVGTPVLRFRVTDTGTVASPHVIRSSGCPAADRRVRKAVAAWRYWPTIRNGVSVPSTVTATIEIESH